MCSTKLQILEVHIATMEGISKAQCLFILIIIKDIGEIGGCICSAFTTVFANSLIANLLYLMRYEFILFVGKSQIRLIYRTIGLVDLLN